MSRILYLTIGEMTPRQREVNEQFLADRPGETHVSGPVAFWMRNPELGLSHEALRIQMERTTSFPKSQSEIAITVANRHWSAEFPWCRHLRAALRAGTEAAPLDELREGKPAHFADPVAQVIYDFSIELVTTTGVRAETYRRAIDKLGLEAVIELTGLVAYGCLLSISSNTFGPEEPEPTEVCTLPTLGPPPTVPQRAAQDARISATKVSNEIEPIRGATAEAAAVWQITPNLSQAWLNHEQVLKNESSVTADIRELVTLDIAKFWCCPQLWDGHRNRAVEEGVSTSTIDAIASGQKPSFANEQQATSWAFVTTLLRDGIASDEVQDQAIASLGVTNVIELVAMCGLQTFVALTLNVFGKSVATSERRMS